MAPRASLTFAFDDLRTAEAVHAALLPEARQGPDGSTTRIDRRGTSLEAEIEATDVSTLRAAINSVVRLLDAATRAIG